MDFISTTLFPTILTAPKFGQRTGLDGKSNIDIFIFLSDFRFFTFTKLD